MARDQIDMTPLQSRDELVAWFEAGSKPPSEFRIGTEHEKTPFTLEGHQPVPYEGARGIGAVEDLGHDEVAACLGWLRDERTLAAGSKSSSRCSRAPRSTPSPGSSACPTWPAATRTRSPSSRVACRRHHGW